MEQEAAYKDSKQEKTSFNYTLLVLTLSVPTLNFINILGSIFCFFILREQYHFWKSFRKLLKIAYWTELAATIIECVVVFVKMCTTGSGTTTGNEEAVWNHKCRLGILATIFCLSGITLIFVSKAYKAILRLYIEFAEIPMIEGGAVIVIKPASEELKTEPVNATNSAVAESRADTTTYRKHA